MLRTILFCGLICLAVCDQQAGDDGDDGTYIPEKYEVPYSNGGDNSIYQPQGGYQAQPGGQAYYPQQAASQPAYRPSASAKYIGDARNAAILSEERYLSADGKFGAAYSQEDGVQFKEESDPDGTRRGSYTWVDPSGQRRTVSYTAGKHGFQPTGDHLPVAPGAPVQQPIAAAPQYQPQAQYQPQPQYQPQAQYQPEPQYEPQAPVVQQYRPQPQYQPQAQTQPIPQNGLNVNGGSYSFGTSF